MSDTEAADGSQRPGSPSTQEEGQDHPHSGFRGLKDKVTTKKEELKDKAHQPAGGYDPTPYADLPSGWTVRFVFHGATNLPAADLSTQSCDPFINATLNAPIPQRHKEDPILTKRTRTIHHTREPEWEEEWIVANVPDAGFTLKCRFYDEDYPDHDDRLGNVTFETDHIEEGWSLGPDGQWFDIKKRSGSKRAYLFKAVTSSLEKSTPMTAAFHMSIEVLGRSEGKGSHMYTIGPTTYFKHFSPLLGRFLGIKVNEDDAAGEQGQESGGPGGEGVQKYDFQANEIQFSGPIPEHLYHRFVEFRPWVGSMFTDTGLRGKVLHKALHKQHDRIYNFNESTQWGSFEPCSEAASLQFLRMAHFDKGGRIFTYVLTLDGLLRFTETGKEFGIDFLSKHTMHSDVATYIACSGEFFIRRLARADAPDHQGEPEVHEPTHPDQDIPDGPPSNLPPIDPRHYQLIIDNDSGTYRPDKKVLPLLHEFLERNLPGIGIVVLHWEDEEDQKLKDKQLAIKKKEGKPMHLVQNHSPNASSISSSDESRLGDLLSDEEEQNPSKSKRETAMDIIENPSRIKELSLTGKHKSGTGHEDRSIS